MNGKRTDCTCDFCIYVYRGNAWRLAKACVDPRCRCKDIVIALGEKTNTQCQGEVYACVPCSGKQVCQTSYCTWKCNNNNEWERVPGTDCPAGCSCGSPFRFSRWKQHTILMVPCESRQRAKKSARGAKKGTAAKKKGKRGG